MTPVESWLSLGAMVALVFALGWPLCTMRPSKKWIAENTEVDR